MQLLTWSFSVALGIPPAFLKVWSPFLTAVYLPSLLFPFEEIIL